MGKVDETSRYSGSSVLPLLDTCCHATPISCLGRHHSMIIYTCHDVPPARGNGVILLQPNSFPNCDMLACDN